MIFVEQIIFLNLMKIFKLTVWSVVGTYVNIVMHFYFDNNNNYYSQQHHYACEHPQTATRIRRSKYFTRIEHYRCYCSYFIVILLILKFDVCRFLNLFILHAS